MWTSIGVGLVTGAPVARVIRWVGEAIWLCCMVTTCYGHAMSFLLTQLRRPRHDVCPRAGGSRSGAGCIDTRTVQQILRKALSS